MSEDNAITKDDLVVAIAKPLKQAHFVRRAATWYRETEEITVATQLRRSRFSGKHFLDIGIWLNKLQRTTYPRVQDCPIITDLVKLYPEEYERLASALTIETASHDSLAFLSEFLTSHYVPYVTTIGTEKGLIRELTQGRLRRTAIVVGADTHLGVPSIRK